MEDRKKAAREARKVANEQNKKVVPILRGSLRDWRIVDGGVTFVVKEEYDPEKEEQDRLKIELIDKMYQETLARKMRKAQEHSKKEIAEFEKAIRVVRRQIELQKMKEAKLRRKQKVKTEPTGVLICGDLIEKVIVAAEPPKKAVPNAWETKMDSIVTVKIESGQSVQVLLQGSSEPARIERGPQVLILSSAERLAGTTFALNARNASFKPEFNWHVSAQADSPSLSLSSRSYSLPFDSYDSPAYSHSFSFDSPTPSSSNLYDIPGTFVPAPSYSFSFGTDDTSQNGNRYSFVDESSTPQFGFVVRDDGDDASGGETLEQRLAFLLELQTKYNRLLSVHEAGFMPEDEFNRQLAEIQEHMDPTELDAEIERIQKEIEERNPIQRSAKRSDSEDDAGNGAQKDAGRAERGPRGGRGGGQLGRGGGGMERGGRGGTERGGRGGRGGIGAERGGRGGVGAERGGRVAERGRGGIGGRGRGGIGAERGGRGGSGPERGGGRTVMARAGRGGRGGERGRVAERGRSGREPMQFIIGGPAGRGAMGGRGMDRGRRGMRGGRMGGPHMRDDFSEVSMNDSDDAESVASEVSSVAGALPSRDFESEIRANIQRCQILLNYLTRFLAPKEIEAHPKLLNYIRGIFTSPESEQREEGEKGEGGDGEKEGGENGTEHTNGNEYGIVQVNGKGKGKKKENDDADLDYLSPSMFLTDDEEGHYYERVDEHKKKPSAQSKYEKALFIPVDKHYMFAMIEILPPRRLKHLAKSIDDICSRIDRYRDELYDMRNAQRLKEEERERRRQKKLEKKELAEASPWAAQKEGEGEGEGEEGKSEGEEDGSHATRSDAEDAEADGDAYANAEGTWDQGGEGGEYEENPGGEEEEEWGGPTGPTEEEDDTNYDLFG